SSLSYLKRFPIDVIKIDRSFVMEITSNPDGAAIVQTILAMAHTLKLRVVAEGVEKLEELIFLREHGCEEMQGYYFSKPVPLSEFEELLRSGKKLLTNYITVS
ncbi:MAG: EAL domain-containing protein, partial [Nitrospirota bacterium]